MLSSCKNTYIWIIPKKVEMILRVLGTSRFRQGVEGSGEMLRKYRDLEVWQKSYRLCLDIYKIKKDFPKENR
jgi:hypothetical protein